MHPSNLKGIKLIIFDLDGTLVDAYRAIAKSFNYAMQGLNLPRQTNQVIRRTVGWGDENLLKPFVPAKELQRALLMYRRHHRIALLRDSRLFPCVEKVLSKLKNKGYKLAVASNRPTQFSLILIRHLRLKKYFDFVLCADVLKQGKPHPEILNRIMQRFSVKPSETLYVADMGIDAQAANRARVRAIIVATGSSTKAEIKRERPYRLMRKITDLLKIL